MATIEEFMKTTKEAGHTAELQRLTDQHAIVTDALNGLLLAPVDFSKPGLKILDSATADGKSTIFLAARARVVDMAQVLVGCCAVSD